MVDSKTGRSNWSSAQDEADRFDIKALPIYLKEQMPFIQKTVLYKKQTLSTYLVCLSVVTVMLQNSG